MFTRILMVIRKENIYHENILMDVYYAAHG